MKWYWYWMRVDKETRMMPPGCRRQFSSREEAVQYGMKQFVGKPFEIEEEQLDKHRTLRTVYVSREAEIVANEGQHKMF
tara:strand:- start:370 stop:606 length:237 start_codon:yes stop_codon:yes gene_type:complete